MKRLRFLLFTFAKKTYNNLFGLNILFFSDVYGSFGKVKQKLDFYILSVSQKWFLKPLRVINKPLNCHTGLSALTGHDLPWRRSCVLFLVCSFWFLFFVLCSLSFVFCPLFFVLCPLFFVLCSLFFVLGPLSFVLPTGFIKGHRLLYVASFVAPA